MEKTSVKRSCVKRVVRWILNHQRMIEKIIPLWKQIKMIMKKVTLLMRKKIKTPRKKVYRPYSLLERRKKIKEKEDI